jgi:lysophospholipid acyltransferase (LPLAT)-like uncharacterized protein
MAAWTRRLTRSQFVQESVGLFLAQYLRTVWHTTRFTIEPPNAYEIFDRQLPVIIAMWHGQHFMAPFVKQPYHKAKVLISRHRDGEMMALAARRLGIETIRGAGSHSGDQIRKGGTTAMFEMIEALEQGWNVALTADVPKVARVAGRGIVMLARYSGRPIIPVAVATGRRIDLDNWDKSSINLPFGRGAVVAGAPITVAPDVDDAVIEAARLDVQSALNDVTRRAYAIAEGNGS